LDGFGEIQLLRCLDSTNRHQAMTQPECFRSSSAPVPTTMEPLELGPWAIATLDFPVL
jgi:hypothetical protein